jgi:UDP-3-O-[3-hydroxymyristoyl] glucosamine N-acyltransferase
MDQQLSDIARDFDHLIRAHRGADPIITAISAVEDCGPGDLVFVEDKQRVDAVLAGQPSGVVVHESLLPLLPPSDTRGVLLTDNVRLAHALIKQRYADRQWPDEWPRIHPSAIVHDSARIPDSCVIGPSVVIGRDVVIGERTRLLAGVVIEHGATLGADCLVHPMALIGHHCQLGEDVEIGPGSIIGSDGYGFAQDEHHKSHRIPQTGIVVIQDRVRIGAQNCIDRAAYGETRIGAGTKTDNLCHIAHGVQIGEDCLLTAMLCVAGSTRLGNRVMTSGMTGILGHLEICDDVSLAHRAGVTQNITEPGIYAGRPLQPLDRHMKTTAHLKKLSDLASRVRRLESKLKALQAKED